MNTRKFSNIQEKTVAKLANGKKHINSGATPFIKGDVSTKNILIECKTTLNQKESFSIKKEWLDKLKKEAFAMNKDYFSLAFNFAPGGENYFIINENFFKNIVLLMEDQNGN